MIIGPISADPAMQITRFDINFGQLEALGSLEYLLQSIFKVHSCWDSCVHYPSPFDIFPDFP
jgi:hypothetical protein